MAWSIPIQHKASGLIKKGYLGVSWTSLFFGWFVPIFRGEYGIAVLYFLFAILTKGLWILVMFACYNKLYTIRMLNKKGWVLAGTEEDHRKVRSILF